MATMERLLAQSWPRSLTGVDVAICTLIQCFVDGTTTNPILSQLLTFTTRLIFQLDPQPHSMDAFIEILDAFLVNRTDSARSEPEDDVETVKASVVVSLRQATTFSSLHNFFTRVERLLLREEMFDDIQNVTVLPAERQIDETSPFGHFLHLCLESYLCLEDDEFGKLVQRVSAWVHNTEQDTARLTDYAPQEEIALALRHGDYASARAALEGSFDRAPVAMLGRTLPETLLHNAKFHVQTRAYGIAKTSVDEALRLARGINATQCVAECDDLLRQIEFEQEMMKVSPSLTRVNSQNGERGKRIIVTHKRDVYRHIDAGSPALSIAQAIERLQAQMRKHLTTIGIEDVSLADLCELDVLLANLWNSTGSVANANVTQRSFSRHLITSSGWTRREQRVRVALLQAKNLSLAGQHTRSLITLLDDNLLRLADVHMTQLWHGELVRALFRAAQASNSQVLIRALIKLRPEVEREIGEGTSTQGEKVSRAFRPNEATFARSERTSCEEDLRVKISLARRLRMVAKHPAQAFALAVETMNAADRADMFPVYRRAAYEAAESLLSLGQSTKAQQMLDSILPQVLSGGDPTLAAQVAWCYAQILLSAEDSVSDEAYRSSLVWLDRAANGFTAVDMRSEAAEAHYVKARICHHLGMLDERDEAAEAHNHLSKQTADQSATQIDVLDRILKVARLAGARAVAGG